MQDACLKMASALVEAEGMECTDPDEVCGPADSLSTPLFVCMKTKVQPVFPYYFDIS